MEILEANLKTKKQKKNSKDLYIKTHIVMQFSSLKIDILHPTQPGS